MVVAEQKKEEKDTQNTRKKKKQRTKTDKKNADFLPFLALFQGKELCFVLCGKQFLIRPLPFGLNSCMTQQNKGVSKTFYKERSTWYLLSYFTLITQNHSNEKRSLNFLLCLTPPSPLPPPLSLPPSPLPPPLSLPPSLSLPLSPSLCRSPLPLSLSPPSLALPSLSRCLSPPSRSLSPLPLSLSLSPLLAVSLPPSRCLSPPFSLSLSLSLSPPLSLSPSSTLFLPLPLSLCPSLSLPAQVDAHKSSAHLGVQWKSPHLDPQHTWRLEHVVTVCGPVTVLRVLTPWGLEDCSWRR